MQYFYTSRHLAYSGFSLIELLLALAISMTALLGFAQLQQKNLSVERELIRSLHARLLLNEISAVLRSSPHPDHYVTSGSSYFSTPNCFTKTCNADEFSRFQLAIWHCTVAGGSDRCQNFGISKSLFPQGKLTIYQSGAQFSIQLKWQSLSGVEKAIVQKTTAIMWE